MADELDEKMPSDRSDAIKWVIASLVVWATAFCIYAVTIGYEFIWDDHDLIVEPGAPATSALADLWSSAFPLGGGYYYRPLVLTTYWLEARVFGLSAGHFHATQTALYAFCCVLVLWLARALVSGGSHTSGRAGLSFPLAAALVFTVHPVHVEAVAFVSARTGLLASLLSIAAVLAGISAIAGSGRMRSGWIGLSALLLLMGLLCKEIAITTPVLSWLAMRVRADRRHRRTLFAVLGAQGFAVVCYLVLRAWGLGALARELEWGDPTLVPVVIGRTAELLVLPIRTRVYYLPWAEPAMAVMSMVGLAAVIAVVALAVVHWRTRPLLTGCLLWIPISLAPTSQIVAIPGGAMAERFLFLPSVGICLLAGLGIDRLLAKTRGSKLARTATLTAVCGLLAALAVGGVMQMPSYRSDLQLFEQIVEEYPDFYYGNLKVGMTHQKAGRPELALGPLQRAVRRSESMRPGDERRGQAERWLGLAYLNLGRTSEAAALLARAAELHPEDAQIQINLAVAYLQVGRTSEAESALETALTLDPESGEAELNLGIALGQRAAHDLALPHFRRAAALLPGLADAHYNLGNGYARLGHTDEAIASYRRALQIRPDHAAALSNLRVVMAKQQAP